MSKLIGTNSNQVPSNADLGTAAFLDTKDLLTSRGSSLASIDAAINKSAIDVHVYDTSKDSDGGAWRKRTQHTSWYNEELNTENRGSRREFPSIAIIVAELDKVTIYDGDDPTLPMWMVFRGLNSASSYTWFGTGYAGENTTSVHMKNATLCIGVSGNVGTVSGLSVVNLIRERFIKYGGADGSVDRNVSLRNKSFRVNNPSPVNTYLLGDNVTGVDMRVLPNSPIDQETGLAVPTIAVGTNSGLTIIKDNGIPVSISITSGAGAVKDVYILEDERVAFSAQQSSSAQDYYRFCIAPIPNENVSGQAYWQSYPDDIVADYSYSTYIKPLALSSSDYVGGNISDISKTTVGGFKGIGILHESDDGVDAIRGMACHIKDSYNTGWMPGDTELAVLNETETGILDASNKVLNGTFGNTSEWYGARYTITGGQATIGGDPNDPGNGQLTQNMAGRIVPGRTYTLTFDSVAETGTPYLVFHEFASGSTSNGTKTFGYVTGASPTSYEFTWTPTNTYCNFVVGGGSTSSLTIDNVVIKESIVDKSANSNHLRYAGSNVKRTAVAPGADLVSYKNFNEGYFKHFAIDGFGAGDVCICGWAKFTNADVYTHVLSIGNQTDSTGLTLKKTRAGVNNHIYLYGNIGTLVSTNQDVPIDEWIFLTAGRHAGFWYVYVNGELINRTTDPNTYGVGGTGTTKVTVGRNEGVSNEADDNTELALVRLSRTFPTDSQIKKMYLDERSLFRENAKCTIYGSTDVRALMHDDSTGLLHVGTPSGRSIFNNIRRVDHTTDPVETALSVSNNFVAEE